MYISAFGKVFCATLLVQLSGCAMLYNYDAISKKPVKGGLLEPMQPRLSTIQPALTIPLSELQAAANSAAAGVLPFSDKGDPKIASIEVTGPFGIVLGRVDLDAHWNYTVTQPAQVRVKGGQDKLTISLPAQIDGGAGFGGDLAAILKLDNKNFGAAANFLFESGLRANTQFCPELINPDLDYQWITPPYVELVGESCILDACIGPWGINLESQVNPKLRPMLQKVAADLQKGIQCEPVRESLAKIWRGYSFPVTLPYEKLYLNVSPKAMHFPGLGVNSTDILVAGRLDATVSLDAVPGASAPIPLPQNIPIPISPGRFSIAIPISTQYYTFEALANQLLTGKKFVTPTPIGKATILPIRVEVYPSGDKIAIGISFAVEYPIFFLNSSGTVWLTAKPTAIDNGRRIQLSDVRVTEKFSNPIWNFAAVVLQETITKAVADGFELDLNPPLSQSENQLVKIIDEAGQGSGVSMNARDVKIGVGRILTNDKVFQIEAILDAIVDAKLDPIRMKP